MSISRSFCVLLLVFSAAVWSATKRFFIPHSHDDLGWLRTIEDYYDEKVSRIFATVIDQLEKSREIDQDRFRKKFVYSEIGYLKLFLNSDPEKTQERIDRLISLIYSHQWEFVNGGISMSDSACPHYEDIISNYFNGLNFIRKRFNVGTKYAWQIDPFGHSAALFFIARKFGMTDAVIVRIADDLRNQWAEEQKLEFFWRFPDGSDILTHVSFGYYPPSSIDCDDSCDFQKFNSIIFEKEVEEWDMRFRYDSFYLIGGDFNWVDAKSRFEFLDLVMHEFPTIRYSLLSEYIQSFDSQAKSLPFYEGDFFVYTENTKTGHDSWSGYFTTKPRLKYKVRRIGKIYRAFKNFLALQFFDMHTSDDQRKYISDNLIDIGEEISVFLHHDCITGTAKVEVDRDYYRRIELAEARLHDVLSKILKNSFAYCDFNDYQTLNVGACELPLFIENGMNVEFFIINPSASETNSYVKIPFSKPTQDLSLVVRENGAVLVSSVDCWPESRWCVLVFPINLPQLGVSHYSIKFDRPTENSAIFKFESPLIIADEGLYYEHVDSIKLPRSALNSMGSLMGERHRLQAGAGLTFDFTTFTIDVWTDQIVYRHKLHTNIVNRIYFTKINAHQSGHYVLNYENNYNFKAIDNFLEVSVVRTLNLREGVYMYGEYFSVALFKYAGQDFYQLETIVEGIDMFIKGMDMILNIKNPKIKNKNQFYTDSNGLFEVKRTKQAKFEDSVFPVSSYIRIEDEVKDLGMYVFNDRAQGGFGMNSTVSLYLQRSAKTQDFKGNDEILKVTEVIMTTHYIYNYEKADAKEKAKVTTAIRNLVDYEFPILLNQQAAKIDLRTQKLLDFKLPPELRYTVDYVDEKSMLFRFQNISRLSVIRVDFQRLMEGLFFKTELIVVEFAYPFIYDREIETRRLKNEEEVQPLDFVCILVRKPMI